MIDIRLIRENKELVKENIKKKFQDHKLPLVDEVYDLDIQFREAKQEADQLRAEKNKKWVHGWGSWTKKRNFVQANKNRGRNWKNATWRFAFVHTERA